MSVVINEFEIIPAPPGDESTPDRETRTPEDTHLRPINVTDILDRDQRRRERLRAH